MIACRTAPSSISSHADQPQAGVRRCGLFCREVRRMRVLSADSHTVEPGDLWTSRLDRKFRDSAPHIEMRGSTALLFAPGIRPFAVGGISASGKSGEDLAKHWKTGYEAVRPSGWDPAELHKYT